MLEEWHVATEVLVVDGRRNSARRSLVSKLQPDINRHDFCSDTSCSIFMFARHLFSPQSFSKTIFVLVNAKCQHSLADERQQQTNNRRSSGREFHILLSNILGALLYSTSS